jgi:hypothetical protein
MKAFMYKDTKTVEVDEGPKAFETAADPSLALKVVLDLE